MSGKIDGTLWHSPPGAVRGRIVQQDQFIGKQIKDFIVQERIGRGAYTMVYRAFQPTMSRDVAVKIIRVATTSSVNEDFQARFDREAKILAELEHLHILPVYDYGIVEDVAFLTMRLVRGGTLADLLEEKGRLDLNEAAHIISQVARALGHAHNRGILHRDLKPENVLLDDSMNAFLSDFGLAKRLVGDEAVNSREGMMLGSPAYMSPEQIRGDTLTVASDVYSLGVLIYHMTTGQIPFDSTGDVLQVLNRHLYELPPPMRELNPMLPVTLEDVVMKALEKRPEDRYTSIDEMMLNFNNALGSIYQERTFRESASNRADQSSPEAVQQALVANVNPTQRRLAIAAVVLTALFIVASLTYLLLMAPPPVPTVLAGQSAPAANIAPSPTIINGARRALRGGGFIAYVACNRTSEFHATRAREMADFAAAYGLELRIYDSESDPSLEIARVEEARADGARGLIPCILNEETILPSLQSAREAGIPIVLSGAGLRGQVDAIFVAGDNYALGEVPGRYAGQFIETQLNGEANVVVLDFPDLTEIVERADGMVDGMQAEAPDAVVIGRYRGATQTFGRQAIENLLADDTPFDVILSINDAGAYGAVDALAAAGIPPDAVHIFSVDAEQLARQYIDDGYYMRASLTVGREAGSRAMVDTMVNLLGGGEIPENVITEPGPLYIGEADS